jgi:NAD(P)-dependent dehydrogenase (short-subunit alcohol dehydrogenase family)
MGAAARARVETFRDRVVVVTGGGSGIGLATAQMVADQGGSVILMGRSAETLRRAADEIGPGASIQPLDVTDEKAVERAFAGIGRIDHLVTAAAGSLRGRLVDLDTAKARALYETRFWGQHHCVKYAVPRMSRDGSIVLFSGWVSRQPAPERSTLAAVDSAIEALARTLARELAPIRVNALVPGQIDTPLWRARLTEREARAYFAGIAAGHPVGRVGTADDVAEAILFLLGNGFTTGGVLDIDGGWR